MTSNVSLFSRTEKFSLVASYNHSKFVADPNREGIPDFQKNINQQVLNKCPFSNSFYAFRI